MVELYLADAKQVREAADLIAGFGEKAAIEATVRAERSRDLGNHVHFCRWRQTRRLIDLLVSEDVIGTVH
ncbi:hypothetical protein [uncultured Sphingomonas sp.]|uniref:hypothetical protein n=1 Tax=uncultured Sphingomonas sp. TaxID=158754 RepID=UPI0035C9F416